MTLGKPRVRFLGGTGNAQVSKHPNNVDEAKGTITESPLAARAHISFSFFLGPTISASGCALEFLIKSAYDGARFMEDVHLVHLT